MGLIESETLIISEQSFGLADVILAELSFILKFLSIFG